MGAAASSLSRISISSFWPFSNSSFKTSVTMNGSAPVNGSKPPSEVDVLIIGAGPSGLLTALWLTRLGVSVRIVDKRATRALSGRADGVQARTLEILDSFELGNGIRANGCMLDDMVVWAPVGENGIIQRVSRSSVWGSDTSFIKPYTAHQGIIEAVMLDGLRSEVEVERAVEPVDLVLDAKACGDHDAYPVTVTLKHLSESETTKWSNNAHSILPDGISVDQPCMQTARAVADGSYQTLFHRHSLEGQTEIVHAKYVLGCDGAHSWVRKKMGIEMLGSTSESMWGVIDLVPITDYPDIRRQGPIVSATHEPIVNVPRENGLTRLYVPLPLDYPQKHSIDALTDPSRAVCKTMLDLTRKALHPYSLDYQFCDWYTLYKVGRRIASAYTDTHRRVLIAGDASHTHTPKAGQGMNVSMQDAHNLGWKLAGVIKGQLKPEVLSTYESERRPVGQKLVALDEELAKGLGGAAKHQKALFEVYDELRRFTDGRAVVYAPGLAVSEPADDTKIRVGTRVHNHYVHAQATSYRAQIMDLLPSDGRWRLLVYGGDVSDPAQLKRVNELGARLQSFASFYRSAAVASSKPWLEVLLIHSAKLDDVSVMSFHQTFRPQDEPHGAMSYMQIWADAPAPLDHDGIPAQGDAHKSLNIDTSVGAMALVRPDTYVAWAGSYEEVDRMEEFVAKILVPV